MSKETLLKENIKVLKKDFGRLNKEVNNLVEEEKRITENLSVLNSKVSEADNELYKILEEISIRNNQYGLLEEQEKDKYSKLIGILEKKKKNKELQLSKIEETIDNRTLHLKNVNSSIKQKTNKLSLLESELSTLLSNKQSIESLIVNAHKELSAINNSIRVSIKQKGLLSEENDVLEKDITTKLEKLGEVELIHNTLLKQNELIKKALANYSTLEQDITILQGRLILLRDENVRAAHDLRIQKFREKK